MVPLASKARAANGLSWAGIILAARYKSKTDNTEKSPGGEGTPATDESKHCQPDTGIITCRNLFEERITV